MRTQADVPRRPRRSRRRVGLIGAGIALFFLLTSLRGIAGFYTTFLWFNELELTSVWKGVLGTKVMLGVVFTVVFFALLWFNLVIAERLAPRFRAIGPEDEIVQRYRQAVGPHAGKVRLATALVFALLAGAGVSSQWNNWLLFRNGGDFGIDDPQFGRDVGFYVFQLPFLSFVVNWLLFAVVIIAIVTLVAHYLNGGISLQSPVQRATPNVKAHISVLLGALALLKAAGYYLQRYELNFSSRGVVDGATYTDVKAQLPALELLIFISLAASVLFLANIRRQGWVLPALGVGLWAFLSVVVGAIYPAFIQKVRVEPAEVTRERPYIGRNVEATRQAFGLDTIEMGEFRYDAELTAADLAQNAEVIRNVRLWDPQFTRQTFQRLQEIRSYYRFNDVDVDRYDLGGTVTQTVMSVRELNPSELPAQSWVNRHLLFTHGFGALVAPANAVTKEGQPAFTLKDVPPEGFPQLSQPRVYYGETMGGYAIVNSKEREIDFQEREGGETRFSRYDGRGGVPMGSLVRRAAFALRFGNLNPLISDLVTPRSRAIFIRDIGERVRTAAPFLSYDADPYPAIIDGRIQWIQDAYTTTSRYPYAQAADIDRVPDRSDLRSQFNYVRNSVKVLIDAYHGSMTFYLVDSTDPIARAYAKAFPELFTPASRMSPELQAHLRYPEDMFRVQTNMFGRYHITDPVEFYNAGDAWHISQDPGSGSPSEIRTTVTTDPRTGAVAGGKRARMDPIYVQLRLPDEDKASFLILQPFVPSSEDDEQQNLTAFMTATTEGPGRSRMRAFIMPRGRQIDGPALVDARAQADPNVSREITLLDQKGSEVKLGNVLVVPVENSLLYIRPLYVQSARNPLPEFKRAIVVFDGRPIMRETLQDALTALFGDAPPTLEQPKDGQAAAAGEAGEARPDGEAPGAGPSPEVQQLLDRAAAAYDAAQEALSARDLAEYERQIKAVGELLSQARQVSGSAAPPPTTTTTAPPSSSA